MLFQGPWLKTNRAEQMSQQNHREFRDLNATVHPPLSCDLGQVTVALHLSFSIQKMGMELLV